MAGVTRTGIIILAGLGASLPIGFSGFFGALITEKAERERHLKGMEEKTDNKVKPIHYEATRFVTIYVALVSGLSLALTAVISLLPFFLASVGRIQLWSAYVVSLALSMITIFLLGIYLGRVAKESGWFYGLVMLTASGFTAMIVFLIQLF